MTNKAFRRRFPRSKKSLSSSGNHPAVAAATPKNARAQQSSTHRESLAPTRKKLGEFDFPNNLWKRLAFRFLQAYTPPGNERDDFTIWGELWRVRTFFRFCHCCAVFCYRHAHSRISDMLNPNRKSQPTMRRFPRYRSPKLVTSLR